MKRSVRGVTLLELMIVASIVAILAAIAIPNYRAYVMRSNRVDATSALLRLAAAQEKFYLQNNTYATNAQISTAPPAGLGLAGTTERGWYTVTIAAGTNGIASGYTATAAAISGKSQAADTQCSSFSITETGARDAVDGASASTRDVCWR
jgi:type IV pilus assembly protein PilE